ncbi:diguanylate cyclase [bacterium]|nr:diguanylate cyclase [bacterium]
MADMSIIGAGSMGSAIAGLARRTGATVQLLAPHLDRAQSVASQIGATAGAVGDELTGEMVVLAVPYPAVAGLLETYADQLAGKVVVDVTNPIDHTTNDGLEVPGDSSSAQQIAAVVPKARVLKAFNTTFSSTLASGVIGSLLPCVLIAGDDADAKTGLIEMVMAAGLDAVDVGGLKRARELEAIGFLQVRLASAGITSWSGGFALVR